MYETEINCEYGTKTDIQTIINQKQNAYLELLKKNTPVAKTRYKQKEKLCQTTNMNAHLASWDKLISHIKHDIHTRHT